MASQDNSPQRASGGRGHDTSQGPGSEGSSVPVQRSRPRRNAFGEHFAPVARPIVSETPQTNGRVAPGPQVLVGFIPSVDTERRTALIASRGSASERRRVSATAAVPGSSQESLHRLSSIEFPLRSSVVQSPPRPTRDIQLPYAYGPIPGDSEPFPTFTDPTPPSTSSLQAQAETNGITAQGRPASQSVVTNCVPAEQVSRDSPSPPRSS